MASDLQRKSDESKSLSSSLSAPAKTETFDQHSALESQIHNAGSPHIPSTEKPSVSTQESEVKGDDEEEDEDTSVSGCPEGITDKIARVRGSTWWFLGALAIAIPLAITATVLPSKTISGIHGAGFLAWLEIVWTAGWILRFCIWVISALWDNYCPWDMTAWEDFGYNTAWMQLFFALSLVAWGCSSVLCRFSTVDSCSSHWLQVFRKVLLATIPVSAIFFAEDVLMEIIVTLQAIRMGKGRNLDKIMRQTIAMMIVCRVMMPARDGEAAETPSGGNDDEPKPQATSSPTGKKVSTVFKILKKLEYIVLSDKTTPDILMDYILGKGNNEEFDKNGKVYPEVCRMKIMEGKEEDDKMIDREQLAKEMKSKQREKSHLESCLPGNKPLSAKEIMNMLDKDEDGCVTWGEFADFYVEIIVAMRDIMRGIRGIKRAARSANLVVCPLLLFVVAIIYAAFFVKNLTSYLTPIWTTVTGLSFALGGTVTEFIMACQFVFSKQPYDVGDRVVIEDRELLVAKVCLLYTVFHRQSDRAVEQIAHSKICNSWITNLTRTKGLSVKEAATIPDNAGAMTTTRLEEHQHELVAFIEADMMRKRYLDTALGNVKLALEPGKGDEQRQQVVIKIKLKDLLVRHENVLARARGQVRDKLEQLISSRVGDVVPPVTTAQEPSALPC